MGKRPPGRTSTTPETEDTSHGRRVTPAGRETWTIGETEFSGALVWQDDTDPAMDEFLRYTDLPSGVYRIAHPHTSRADSAMRRMRDIVRSGFARTQHMDPSHWRIPTILAPPLPAPGVATVLGSELAFRLLSGKDVTEAIDVADLTANGKTREAFLDEIIQMLRGSYKDPGIKQWFTRPRYQLCGQRPVDMFTGAWRPEDEGPQQVHALAAALGAPLAT